MQWLVWSILSIAVLVDVVSTALLMFYLHKNKTGFKRTDSTVDMLMVYGVNTGLSTSVVAILALICVRDYHWASVTAVELTDGSSSGRSDAKQPRVQCDPHRHHEE